MKKLIAGAALAAAILAGCSDSGETVVVETKYGSLTQNEFYDQMKQLAGTEILEQVVMTTILEEKYTVTDEDIDALYASYEEEYGDSLSEVLASYGYTEETFRDSLHSQALQQKALEDVDVTDEELQKYYEQAKYELHARHILVDTEEEANDIIARLEKGEDFAAIAKELSNDTTSAENGGDLDWFTVGSMVDSFNDAAYALEAGEVSAPVASDYGYHVIELLEKREVEDYGTFEEEKEAVQQAVIEKKAAATEWETVEAKLLEEAELSIKDKDLQGAFQTADE